MFCDMSSLQTSKCRPRAVPSHVNQEICFCLRECRMMSWSSEWCLCPQRPRFMFGAILLNNLSSMSSITISFPMSYFQSFHSLWVYEIYVSTKTPEKKNRKQSLSKWPLLILARPWRLVRNVAKETPFAGLTLARVRRWTWSFSEKKLDIEIFGDAFEISMIVISVVRTDSLRWYWLLIHCDTSCRYVKSIIICHFRRFYMASIFLFERYCLNNLFLF